MRVNFGSASTLLQQLVNILSAPKTGTVGAHNVAAAGTPEQLAAQPARSIVISARDDNTSRIAWGWTNAVRAGVGGRIGASLTPGQSIAIDVQDASDIWIDAAVNGEGITYTTST